MKSHTRRLVLIGSTVAIILVLACAGVWYELTHYRRAYEQLTRGTSKADVLRLFGKPGGVTDCRFKSQSWDGEPEKLPKTCVEIFEYFSKYSIGEWQIGFDKDGQVVSKAYLQSP